MRRSVLYGLAACICLAGLLALGRLAGFLEKR